MGHGSTRRRVMYEGGEAPCHAQSFFGTISEREVNIFLFLSHSIVGYPVREAQPYPYLTQGAHEGAIQTSATPDALAIGPYASTIRVTDSEACFLPSFISKMENY